MNRQRINNLLNKLPTNLIVILTILIWIVPTVGLLITSLRPLQAINTTGWWTIFSPPTGYQAYLAFQFTFGPDK